MILKFYFSDKERALPLEEVLGFWRIVLKGPLISLVQNPNHATLRSVGVDCLATIEEDIFEQLPVIKKLCHIYFYLTL